ncbi:phage tail protein, partial [Escherichia coli]
MPVSCYLCIFLNVGLGEAAKMPAATALASSAGNITIPV